MLFKSRSRECKNGTIGDDGCHKASAEKTECGVGPCPIFWTEWSSWSECLVFCGAGEIERTRICKNKIEGKDCGDGVEEEITACNNGYCSDDFFVPHWSEWGEFQACSETCGEGVALSLGS